MTRWDGEWEKKESVYGRCGMDACVSEMKCIIIVEFVKRGNSERVWTC